MMRSHPSFVLYQIVLTCHVIYLTGGGPRASDQVTPALTVYEIIT